MAKEILVTAAGQFDERTGLMQEDYPRNSFLAVVVTSRRIRELAEADEDPTVR